MFEPDMPSMPKKKYDPQMDDSELKRLSVPGLLRLYSNLLEELTSRNIVRSTNNPVADFAEYLVVNSLNLRPAAKSTKGYDAVDNQGCRYEIKGRRNTRRNRSRMLSVIRDCESGHFHFLAGVIFREDFSFHKACLVPHEIVVRESVFRKHVNGHILQLRDSLWNVEGVQDITDTIRAFLASDKALTAKADHS
jgi:hypothetical protein